MIGRDENPDELQANEDERHQRELNRLDVEYNEQELRDVLIDIATTRIIEGAQT